MSPQWNPSGLCWWCGRPLASTLALYCPRRERGCRQAAYEARRGLAPGRTRAETEARAARAAARDRS